MNPEPAHYSVLQPDDDFTGLPTDSWILVLEVPNAGPNLSIGTFDSKIGALKFAAEFDEHISSAQHWLLIGTYLNPCVSMVVPHLDLEQLR